MDSNSSAVRVHVPVWFRVVALMALMWNLIGCAAFLQQALMDEQALSALPAAEQALYRSLPMWATVAFAIAVFGGLTGSLALLLRRRFALILLTASLLGVLLQMFHFFMLSRAIDVLGPTAAVMPGLVIVIAFALVWLARHAAKRGWML